MLADSGQHERTYTLANAQGGDAVTKRERKMDKDAPGFSFRTSELKYGLQATRVLLVERGEKSKEGAYIRRGLKMVHIANVE